MAGQVDFYTMLSGLGDTLASQRKDAALKQALSGSASPDGSVDFGKAILGLAQSGDLQRAAQLAQIQGSQDDRRFRRETDARDFAFRQDQERRKVEGDRVPAGYERNPAGGLRHVTGGPADPAVIAAANEAKAKPRQASIGDIRKLSEEGGKYANVAGFGDTFDDKYAGYRSQWVGETANTIGRNAPGMVSEDTAKGAQWWQGYDRYKNVIRNDQFGSALTATEKAAFEQADINPGMDPKTIRVNLKRQKEIIGGAIAREAGAMVEAGYDPNVIAKSYGIKLSDFGIEPKSKKGAAPATTSGGDPLARARDAIARGANRDAVMKRLVENGINPSGL